MIRKGLIVLIILFVIIGCEKQKICTSNKIELTGVIRRVNPGAWHILDDEGHMSMGIRNISEDNDRIIIYFDFVASKVQTFVITPDETFSRLGLQAGASVGLDKAVIYLSKIENGVVVPVNPLTISDKDGNFWIYGVFSK